MRRGEVNLNYFNKEYFYIWCMFEEKKYIFIKEVCFMIMSMVFYFYFSV